MPGGMPYQIEKGPTLRVIERHINNAPAAKRRAMLDVLRRPDQPPTPASMPDPLAWITTGVPELWDEPAFAAHPLGGGRAIRDHIIMDWFGYRRGPTGGWVKPPSSEHPDTGHWIAYRGDVDVIVRRALRWAFELALGLAPGDTGPGRERPWQIELFWKCLAPWFEAWVLHRPIADTGLVTVVFVTPSHRGANLSESPVATHPEVTDPDLGHPVPSFQDDYELLGRVHPLPNRPRVPARERKYGTWVVTHTDHESTETVSVRNRLGASNVGPRNFSDWGITQLGRYEGVGDVVTVAPSMAAGGVKHDGGV
jgi:hypothetical protein